MSGGNGEDTLYRDYGYDWLSAGNGQDTLYGGEGNDILVGGANRDELSGYTGADTFLMERVSDISWDWILDFTQSQGDKIDLSNIDAKDYQ